MALTQVKAAGIAADSIDETKIADNGIDSEHYNDGSIDHVHLANDAIDGDNLADNAVDSEHYTDGSIDHVHLAADAVDGDNIADDSIDSEHYADGSIDEAHIADDAVSLSKMAGLARGKIIYGDSSGNPAALALGSNGQVLKSDGTDIAWAADAGGAALSNDANNRVTTADGSGGINGEANLTFDGNDLTLGDGNIIFADGHGIDFSSHGTDASGRDNELLSHTEYGTWDPQDQSDNDISTGTGHYAVVGRFCYIVATFNSDNPSSSVTHIKGQPFAPQRLGYNQHTYGLLYKNPGGGNDESGLSLYVCAQNTHSTGSWHIVTDHSGFANTDYQGFQASYVIN